MKGEHTMTMKEQERKALEKIRKIVEELGEDSYVGTAFTGCFDDAEANIDNDWALSMYDRWQSAEQKFEHANAELEEQTLNLADANCKLEDLQGDCDEWKRRWENKAEELKETKEAHCDLWKKFRAQQDRADALEQEIIKLKAKLYDLITAE